MIKEFELYHGAALCSIIQSGLVKRIELYPSETNSSYILNGEIGLYIKYSTKRLSPWRFTFKKEHRDEILEMYNAFKNVFILLVCHTDGVACLSFEELKKVLDQNHEEIEWVSASRSKREQYKIKGTDGALKFKIGVNEWEKIFTSKISSQNISFLSTQVD